jgi:hypothetical protein
MTFDGGRRHFMIDSKHSLFIYDFVRSSHDDVHWIDWTCSMWRTHLQFRTVWGKAEYKGKQPRIVCSVHSSSFFIIEFIKKKRSGRYGSVNFLFASHLFLVHNFYVRTKAITCEHSNILLPSLASVKLIYFALMEANCWKKSFFVIHMLLSQLLYVSYDKK